MALPKTETFTNSDGTALTTHNASYSNVQGAFAINTNACYSNTAATETCVRWNGDTFNNDQYSFGTIKALITSTYIGVGIRASAAAITWYGYYSDGGFDRTLYKMIANSFTALGQATAAAANDLLRIEATGTAILAKRNGTNEFGGAVTDSSIASGYGGIVGYASNSGSRIDDAEFGNLGAVAASLPPIRRARSLRGLIVR